MNAADKTGAKRLEGMYFSPIRQVMEKVAKVREAGHPVISLSAGEPDFNTPNLIKEKTIEALLQIKQGQDPMHSLQLGDLLVGGIVIAALGAVNDVAMSISSAMNELVAVNPALTRRQLLRSGMNIGRDMVGTMTNTLILALVGSSLVLMIYLSSLEPSFSQLMSGTFFSVEMVQAIASSVGVILAVPLSALIGAFLFAKHKK